MKMPQLSIICAMVSVSLLLSCVKDTDFEQAEDITLTPVVELNLIFFDLPASSFFDSNTNTPRLQVSDTTDIRFLDDSEIQESLIRAEFFFKFDNSIPSSFDTQFDFLSADNEITYTTSVAVQEGEPSQSVITEFIENIEGDQILNLTQADKVVVTVTIPEADESLEGNLNLQSKTTYYLEIKERN